MIYIEIRIGMLCTDDIAPKKITAFEFWCYRRILKISWNDYVSNEEVLLKINIEKPELLQSVIKREIRYLGHILRESAGKDLKKMTKIGNEKKGRGERRTNWTSIVFENMKKKGFENCRT